MNKIDIIIPAWKAHDTLPRLLASIATQTIAHLVEVYVCNDAGPDYNEIVKDFSPFLTIHELTLPKNAGCGQARQYGIDHSSNPFLVFMDADDVFAGPFSLQKLLVEIDGHDDRAAAFGKFVEEQAHGFVPHEPLDPWMHGKIYRRSYLDKWSIRFNLTRANEDGRFNRLCFWLADNDNKVMLLEDTTYIWLNRSDSTVRANNGEYAYHQSVEGHVDNSIELVQELDKKLTTEEGLLSVFNVKIEVLVGLYRDYLSVEAERPEFLDKCWYHCRRYYDAVIRPIKNDIPMNILAQKYYTLMHKEYTSTVKAKKIPGMVFWTWLRHLDAEPIE